MNWLKLFNKKQPHLNQSISELNTYEQFSSPAEISIWVVEWNTFVKSYLGYEQTKVRKTYYMEEDADEMIKKLISAAKFMQIKTEHLNIQKYKSA